MDGDYDFNYYDDDGDGDDDGDDADDYADDDDAAAADGDVDDVHLYQVLDYICDILYIVDIVVRMHEGETNIKLVIFSFLKTLCVWISTGLTRVIKQEKR